MRLSRNVLVHCHIYKNAGSSIDRLLWESFGDAFALVEPMPGDETLDIRAVRRYLEENPHIKAISSHRLHPPFDIPGALPIVMLRHPVDRARSAYAFARRNPEMPDHSVARAATFAEYVGWSLARRGEGAILRNHQVQHLSGAAYRTGDDARWQANEDDLAEARNLLCSLPAFGLVRRFAESCSLFNAQYKPILPAVTFFDHSENTTGDPALTEEAVLGAIRADLGEAGCAALEAANELDLQLYAFARRLFARRISENESPQARLWAGLRLLSGRVRQRVREPELYRRGQAGLGSSRFPVEPALVRLGR